MRGHIITKSIDKYKNIDKTNLKQTTNIKEKDNDLLRVTTCKIDKEFTNFTASDINKYITDKSTLVIFKDNSQSKLIIKEEKNILFISNSSTTFINIFLPEIIKKYSSLFPNITKENLTNKNNKCFYNVNDNLYILNYEERIITPIINFLHELYKQNNYKLEISKNYLDEEIEENEPINYQDTNKIKYSYGYINILLISFILSIITIIICLLR